MKALKTKKRALSLLVTLVVALTMVFGGSAAAFADTTGESTLLWSYYGGNDWKNNKSISAPAYYDGSVYALVQDGSDAYLKKFAEADGTETVLAKLEGMTGGYTTLAPTVDAAAGKIYVPLTGAIAVVPISGGIAEYVETKTGYQTISPVTYDSEYIYVGTYKSNTGDYYRISKSNLDDITIMVENTSFYWAGACMVTAGSDSCVMFGSDASKIYLYNNKTEVVADSIDVEGKVRTTITSDGSGNYYFATNSGKLYKVSVSDQQKISVAAGYPVALTGNSTCTPVIMDGKIYVGTAKKTVDVFNADGSKDAELSVAGLKGNVQGLAPLNGSVYASYNNKPGGIYDVTAKADHYVPETDKQQYNAYLPVTNGKDKIFFKNDSGYLFAVSAKSASSGTEDPVAPENPETVDSADVYVTIADKGKLVLVQEKVKVADTDNDGALTVNDALYAAHEQGFEGGAAAGYGSAVQSWGLSITKLWGDTSGSFGYWVNNASAMSLADPVKDGDYVNAFVYEDQAGWSDKFCWFDKNATEVKIGENVELTLNAAGYDANWNPVSEPVASAVIVINGEQTELVTDGNGKVTIAFDKAGTYTVSAVSETLTLVPPVCKVTVTDMSAAGDDVQQPETGTGVQTGDETNVIVFGIIAIIAFVAAAVAGKHVFGK